jgi:hypothetical protein
VCVPNPQFQLFIIFLSSFVYIVFNAACSVCRLIASAFAISSLFFSVVLSVFLARP